MRPSRKSWEAFAAAARPVIEAYRAEHHGRTPGQRKFRRLGHGWIVSAAVKHHGGWRKMLRRLDLPQVIRTPGHAQGTRPVGYWRDDANVRRELAAVFPELLAWNTMPSTKLIQAKLMGLWSFASHHGGLAAMTRRLGLYPYLVGVRLQQRVADISWVLDFYEAHQRWPHSSECPWRIRCRRFVRGTSWHDFCRPPKLPLVGVLQVIDRFEQYRDWLQRHQPRKVLVRQRVLNHHIVDLHRRFPPLQ